MEERNWLLTVEFQLRHVKGMTLKKKSPFLKYHNNNSFMQDVSMDARINRWKDAKK